MKKDLIIALLCSLLVIILSYKPLVIIKEEVQQEEPQTGGLEVEPEEIIPTEAKYRFPIATSDYEFTSPQGIRVSPITHTIKSHTGIDIASTWHAQVVSVADGIIIESWPPPDGYFKGHPIYGGMLQIRHEDGSESVYAHLSASYVKEGQQVQSGQVIGRIGNTGQSDGEHLHFELHINGKVVNPLLYIEVPEK